MCQSTVSSFSNNFHSIYTDGLKIVNQSCQMEFHISSRYWLKVKFTEIEYFALYRAVQYVIIAKITTVFFIFIYSQNSLAMMNSLMKIVCKESQENLVENVNNRNNYD